MIKQGKVKLVNVEATELREGLQVCLQSDIKKIRKTDIKTIKKIESDLWIEGIGYLTGKYSDYDKTLSDILKDVKKLVIEYDVRGKEGDEKYDKRNHLPSEPYQNQIALKNSQWEAAIKNGEVDSDKVVRFEPIRQIVEMKAMKTPNGTDYHDAVYIEYGKIIPSKDKKKIYSDEDVRRIVKEIIKEADYLDFTHEYGIKGWSELEKALNQKL